METNALPHYDMSDNPTDCCPRFNPDGWDDQDLHFSNKQFVKAKTRSVMHVPVNMGKVFEKTFKAIEHAGALDMNDLIIMSRDVSPWAAEHYFAVSTDVPGEEMTQLSGDYRTKVFEGAYKDAPKWRKALLEMAPDKDGREPAVYFFYTTCPKCAKHYGKNYVVGLVETGA